MSQIDLQWFAAEDEGKTEQPSEHKLRKAREEGRVAKSQELNGMIVFFFVSIVFIFLAPWMKKKCMEILIYYFNNITAEKVNDQKFYMVFLKFFLTMVIPVSVVGIVAGVVANLIQNKGFLFTTKTITPKFNKILPKFGEYFKRTLFSMQGLFNIFKSILKVALISIIAFVLIRSDLNQTLAFLHTDGPNAALSQVGKMVSKLLIISSIVLILIAIADYFMQRKQFIDSLKMTKQEVKQEYKELEGDPEVKGHLESAQREMLSKNMPKAVREADVVITNPTHFAVALQWKREQYDSPQVTAKGEDLTAQNMKRIARENDVPIVENKPLARGLYNDVEIGSEIPDSYLKAISTVYVQIHYLDKQAKS